MSHGDEEALLTAPKRARTTRSSRHEGEFFCKQCGRDVTNEALQAANEQQYARYNMMSIQYAEQWSLELTHAWCGELRVQGLPGARLTPAAAGRRTRR